jgi:Fe-S oxidoreductase
MFFMDQIKCRPLGKIKYYSKIKVWKLKGPKVVSSFLWKACNNILATQTNLHQRGITQDPLCPICGLVPETVEHSLWTCTAARDVWHDCPAGIHKCTVDDDIFVNIFMKLQERLEEEEMLLVAITVRSIWLRRNAAVFGG